MSFHNYWTLFFLLDFISISAVEHFKVVVCNSDKVPKHESTKEEKKVYFGDKTSIYFAYGTNLEKDIDTCPYCKTKQHL